MCKAYKCLQLLIIPRGKLVFHMTLLNPIFSYQIRIVMVGYALGKRPEGRLRLVSSLENMQEAEYGTLTFILP